MNPDSESVWNEPSDHEEGSDIPADKDFDELWIDLGGEA